MKYKIDIFTIRNIDIGPDDWEYFGSIAFESSMPRNAVFDFLHYGGGSFAYEGLIINDYQFTDYVIITIKDYRRNGEVWINLLRTSNDLEVFNPIIESEVYATGESIEYFVISEDDSGELSIHGVYEILKQEYGKAIRSKYLCEYGCTGFWENFLIGVASSAFVTIADRLIEIGFQKSRIKSFRLPDKAKKLIANEYGVNEGTLFIDSYYDDNNGTRVIVLKNIEYQFAITFLCDEVKEFKAQKLTRFL